MLDMDQTSQSRRSWLLSQGALRGLSHEPHGRMGRVIISRREIYWRAISSRQIDCAIHQGARGIPAMPLLLLYPHAAICGDSETTMMLLRYVRTSPEWLALSQWQW